MCGTAVQAEAQGVYINKKSGESIAYPAAIFDRITPMTQQNGVDVWKTDGTHDSYLQTELESITTYEEYFDQRITQDIPQEYLSKMSAYMPIYSGNTPPNIEGTYKVSKTVMVHNSNPNDSYQAGRIFADMINEFSSQDMTQNTVQYRSQEVNNSGEVISSSSKEEAKVIGEGSTFTVFTVIKNTHSDGGWAKTATLISGTKDASGIKDYFRGVLLLDKYDPNKNIMNIGEFRIFKDQDGMSEPAGWTARQRISTPEGSESEQLPFSTQK